MEKKNRLFYLVAVSMGYILIMFIWWSVLLMRKSNQMRIDAVQLLRYEHQIKNIYADEPTFKLSQQYVDLSRLHLKQNRMIWSEGIVLFLGLVGLFLAIYNTFQREVRFASQQRNFLLSITHELKSPLASIKLVLETFVKRHLEPAQITQLSQSALSETARLNDLVNDLLLSAKLDSTGYEPYFESLNLSEFLTEIVEKFKIKFPKAEFHTSFSEMPLLNGDRQALSSVFTNLLENAVKYSPDLPKVFISAHFKNEHFIVDVADNGIGILPAYRPLIFDRFYRIGNEDTRNTKGTGLGLYIVAQIVKRHRGSIQVLSNAEKGSIFRTLIPLENLTKLV
jgi:signal transduction histidine kinase